MTYFIVHRYKECEDSYYSGYHDPLWIGTERPSQDVMRELALAWWTENCGVYSFPQFVLQIAEVSQNGILKTKPDTPELEKIRFDGSLLPNEVIEMQDRVKARLFEEWKGWELKDLEYSMDSVSIDKKWELVFLIEPPYEISYARVKNPLRYRETRQEWTVLDPSKRLWVEITKEQAEQVMVQWAYEIDWTEIED